MRYTMGQFFACDETMNVLTASICKLITEEPDPHLANTKLDWALQYRNPSDFSLSHPGLSFTKSKSGKSPNVQNHCATESIIKRRLSTSS